MKSILIIDTPKDCDNCPCADGELGICQADEKQRNCDWYKVPLWCPLKPMLMKVRIDEDDVEVDSYWQGWNDCIDATTGETE